MSQELKPAAVAEVAQRSALGEPFQARSHLPGVLTQTALLTQRSLRNNARNLAVFWLRLAMYVMLCVCIGTCYFRMDKSWTSVQSRAGLLFFVCAFLCFMSISAFPAFQVIPPVYPLLCARCLCLAACTHSCALGVLMALPTFCPPSVPASTNYGTHRRRWMCSSGSG